MKKITLALVLLVSISLLSCKQHIVSGTQPSIQYVVVGIEPFPYSPLQHLCSYSLSDGNDYILIKDDCRILDTAGKFKIGDTVYISLTTNVNTMNKQVKTIDTIHK